MKIDDNNTCPRCRAVLDPATGLCGCPAAAREAATSLDYSPAPGALVAQAELLFETYLAARLVRARRQVKAAKVALLRDPRARIKLDELRRAEQETERLQAQLLEQARKAAQTREQNRARPLAVPPAPEPEESVHTRPTERFREAQAAKAEDAYDAAGLGRRSRPDDRDCPRCGGHVSGDSTACACGYQFIASDASVVVEPFLTDEEITALRKTVKAS